MPLHNLEDLADAGPKHVETAAAGPLDGSLGEDFSTGLDAAHRVVIEGDEPVGIVKHEPVVMRQVDEMQQGFLA